MGMTINRNGKHWCDPASEEPGPDDRWTCPEDGRVWVYDEAERLWSEMAAPAEEGDK